MIIDDQFLFWHYDGDDASGRAKYYGLTRQSVEIAVMNSDRVLFSIGRSVAARFFKSRFPFSKTIYLYPESDEQLRQQLIRRGDEEQNELNFRLSNLGKHETYADSVFDHRLLNQPGNLYETMKIAASLIGVQGAE
jgi:guanylate kinase